jgi:hypothetical protein
MYLYKKDDYLELDYFNFLVNSFLDGNFAWFFQSDKVNKGDNRFNFIHTFYKDENVNSNHINLLDSLFKKLKVKQLIRVKLNLTTKTNQIEKFDFHRDVSETCKTSILYLNTNDGYTILRDRKNYSTETVSSVANKLITFPSFTEHAGTTHTNTEYRMVLNLNYK